MSLISTKKVLDSLKAARLIEDWRRETVLCDSRKVRETYHFVKSKTLRIEHEIYGRRARMYFSGLGSNEIERRSNADAARIVLFALEDGAIPLNNKWNGPSKSHFEISVSYFKGPHWWE